MGGSIEDTMFFPRLRRHAKWMFVFLALVFALGFVGFGVGAGGVGIGDLFKDNSGGQTGASVSDARKKTEENPNDAAAWRELSTALQTEGETAQAVAALERAVELQPKDVSMLRELSALYISQGSEKVREAQAAQAAAGLGGSGVPGGLTADGTPITVDKVAEAVSGSANAKVNAASLEARTAFENAVATYQKVAKLQPKDPNVQLELAQTAQSAGDNATAIAAYQRFLQLAPDDANAPLVKQQIKTLQSGQSSGG
jgi:tetratricopeptide (TPR) repeat protein